MISEGGIIRDGYSAILDEYRSAATNGKQWIVDLEAKEREATGIKNLRIQYNRVFGYYIEVTKSYYDMVPMRYQRRQTLANSERYITPELREIEQKIVGAQEQSVRLELQLFTEIREKIAGEIVRIQHTAQGLKTLDALLSLAKVAVGNHYVRPEITQDGSLEIIEGRHPVVEQTMQEGGFVPNDAVMDQDQARMLIITGPNMAGQEYLHAAGGADYADGSIWAPLCRQSPRRSPLWIVSLPAWGHRMTWPVAKAPSWWR